MRPKSRRRSVWLVERVEDQREARLLIDVNAYDLLLSIAMRVLLGLLDSSAFHCCCKLKLGTSQMRCRIARPILGRESIASTRFL